MKRFEDKSKIAQIANSFISPLDEDYIIDWDWKGDALTIKLKSNDGQPRIYSINLFFEGEAANEEVGDFTTK